MISKKQISRLTKNEKEKYEKMFKAVEAENKREEYDMEFRVCSCAAAVEELKRKVDAMQPEINILRGQLKIAIDAIAEQKVLIRQLVKGRIKESSTGTIFPLKTEDDMNELNEEINDDNKDQYINTMASLLLPAGVLKNLKNILSNEVVQDYNIDGVQGKKSLKSLENFYSALLDSITASNAEGQGGAEEQLRKAIQLMKKRISKAHSIERQKTPKFEILDI